ncbi:MAG TPA: hypothetical protein VF683_02395 [Chthoniobacterales bacterium]
MKAKLCLAAVALSGSLVIAFAAEKKATDPCSQAYDKAVLSCENERAKCKLRGSDEGTCDNRYNKCENDAKKAQSECQAKSGNTAQPKQPQPKR